MKRNILFSLMMIGAVASLIAGASFSAFTDSDSLQGTITAGNVQVSIGGPGELSWDSTEACPGPIGSEDICTSTVDVNYSGNLDAYLTANLAFTPVDDGTPAGCFLVGLTWDPSVGTIGDSTDGTSSPLELLVPQAQDGVLTITVQIDPDLPDSSEGGPSNESCQDAAIDLDLTVTATEGEFVGR